MNPVIITNGKENPTSGESVVQVMCWHNGTEKYLADMIGAKMPNGDFMKVTDPVFEPALVGHKPEIAGRWVSQTFLIPDNTLILLYANKRTHWQDAGRPARMILRVREKAALRQVEFATLRLSVSSKGTVDVARGRFDVLSVEDALKLGYRINPVNRDHYSQENMLMQFETKVLESELVPQSAQTLVQTQTTEGTKTVVVRTRYRDL